MKTVKTSSNKKIVALWLCFTILAGFLPLGLLPLYANEPDPVFTITVEDQDGYAIQGATICGTFGTLVISGTTNQSGILELQDITDKILYNLVDKELILTITALGYHNIIDYSFGFFGVTVGDEIENVLVEMEGKAASITTQPQGNSFYVGQALSLYVVATNVRSFQWEFRAEGESDFTTIAGETNAVFSIPATLPDAGCFRVVITGTDGDIIISDEAAVIVNKIATSVGIIADPGSQQVRPNAVELSAIGLPSDATGTLTFYNITDNGNTRTQIGNVITIDTGTQTVNFHATGPINEYVFLVVFSGNDTKYYGSESPKLPFSFIRGIQTTPLVITAPSTVTYGNNPFPVTANGGDGTGSIIWWIIEERNPEGDLTNGVATIDSDGIVTIHMAGSFRISAQRGADYDFNAMPNASDSAIITVNRGVQVGFGFDNIAPIRTFYPNFEFSNVASGGQGNGAITYAIIGGTGLADINPQSGLISNVTRAGTIYVRATRARDGRWQQVTADYVLTINRANQTGFVFDVLTPASQTFSPMFSFVNIANGGQTEHKPTYAITGGTGEAEIDIITGEITNVTRAGTIVVTATKLGDDLYNSATAEYTLTVLRANQTGFEFGNIEVVGGEIIAGTQNVSNFLSNDFRYGMSIRRVASGGQSASGAITYQITSGNNVATIDANGTITMAVSAANAPTSSVTITVSATRAGDLVWNEKTITFDLTIHRDNVTTADFRVNGQVIRSVDEWYNAADVANNNNGITVTPHGNNTQISTDGLVWYDSLVFIHEGNITTRFFLRNGVTGAITNLFGEQTINFDRTAPEYVTIMIQGQSPWANFWHTITFGIFLRDSRQITITATDSLSGVALIEFYEDNSGTNFTLEQVASWDKSRWTAYDDSNRPSISFNEFQAKRVVIYTRVTDNAGNISFFRTDGMVFDNMNPGIEVTLPDSVIEITLLDGSPIGLFSGDVPFRVQVTDSSTDGVASGLASITTTISAPGREDKVITATAVSPLLNPYDISFDSANITSAFNNIGTYIVESSFNSNFITITVVAYNKAGNRYERSISLAIDITPPIINVSYDNNTFTNGVFIGNGNSRVATIEITELNFVNSDVIITVTRDGQNLNIAPAFTAIPDATDSNGGQIGWRMIIDFAQFGDGDFTFDISYTDKAGNANVPVNFGSSINPRAFTIDNTSPIIEITFENSDAGDPSNTNHFRGTRTATIRVVERNWRASDFVLTLIAEYNVDGVHQRITAPQMSAWTSNGYERIATINFTADGRYTLTALYIDLAGNTAVFSRTYIFYIDRTAPVLYENSPAQNGGVSVYTRPIDEEPALALEFYDTNISHIVYTIRAYRFIKSGIDRDIALFEMIYLDVIRNRVEGSSAVLPLSLFIENGVYEITAVAFDLAGNSSGEIIHTHVVMREINMMAYIPRNALVEFNGIHMQAVNFPDIPIRIFTLEDAEYDIVIGGLHLVSGRDLEVSKTGMVNGVTEHRVLIPNSFIAREFNDDNQIYELPINVGMNPIRTVGRMVINNVRPEGFFESNFRTGIGFYGVQSQEIQIVRLSDGIDPNATTVYVNGYSVPFAFNAEARTITFTLERNSAYGHPWDGHSIRVTLVDTAGNEFAMEEISNVYVGSWLGRYWMFFAISGVIVASGVAIVGFKLIKRKQYS